jgi:hypothetical protein
MSKNKIVSAAIDGFKQKLNAICQNNDELFDKVDAENFHLLTEMLMTAAQEAGKAGLIQYLRENDMVCPYIERNKEKFRYKGTSDKELLTLFGTINFERAMYYDEKNGGDYFLPLDAALGLHKDDFATLETREMILFASALGVPSEVEQLLKKSSLCHPSRTAIQNIINRDGSVMEELRQELADKVYNEQPIHSSTEALVVSLDGVNVLLREAGLKKGRKPIRPTDNQTYGPSSTSYHNAMVGSVSLYCSGADKKPERLSSVYVARMPEEKSTEFKVDFERIVGNTMNKLNKKVPHVLLTDGHLMIKGFAARSELLQPFEKLLDFYHATEHLSKAADAIFGEKSDLSKAYFTKWRERLKTDPSAPNSILRSLEGYDKRIRLTKKQKSELKTEIVFFKKNRKLMRYAEFIKRGLPIGSGPIEAAAKSIVRQRMCRSGMSWSREKGQYVLTIRAYVKSGLWDVAWEKYKELKKVA